MKVPRGSAMRTGTGRSAGPAFAKGQASEPSGARFGSGQFNPRYSFLAVLALDGTVLHVNEAVLTATAVHREQVLGKPFWTTIWWHGLPVAAQWPRRLSEVLRTGGPYLGEDPFHDGHGQLRFAQIALTLIADANGWPDYYLVEGHDVTQAKRTVAELEEKQAMLTSAQRLARLGSWYFDVAEDRTGWSPETFRIHGLPRGASEGVRFEEFIDQVHPQDRQALTEVNQRALAGQRSFSYQYRFCSPDGKERLIRGDGEAQLDACGQVVRLVGTVMDVTEQEEMRLSAKRNESRLRSLAGSATEWYWEQDQQHRFTLFSGGRNGQLVSPPVQMVGRRRWEIPEATPLTTEWWQHRATLDAQLAFCDFEYRLGVGADVRIISSSGIPAYDDGGTFIGYRGTSRDISVQRAAQAQAREATALLGLATRLSRLGAWAIDAGTLAVTWSGEALAIQELNDAASPTLTQAAEFIHPDWRDRVRAVIRSCLSTGKPFDIEVRARTARHNPIWVRLIGEAVRGGQGQVIRIQGAVQDISERKDAAERYKELGERLTKTLESVTDAFLTLDRDWRFTYLNKEAERLFGRRREDLIGKVAWEEFPRSVGSVFHLSYERAFAEFTTVRFEAFSDSLQRWLSVVAYPSIQGLVIYARDVSETRNVRRALVESEERYRLLFESSMDAIVQASPDGHVLRANPAACRMFEMTEGELRRVELRQLVDGQDGRVDALVGARDQNGEARGELSAFRRDGSRFEIEATTSRYTTSDGVVLTHLIFRDITERLRYQREVLMLNSDLSARVQRRTADLERANVELKGFAHSLAHDLRAPIATISGFSARLQEMLDGAASEKAQHYARRIQASAQRMDEFVDALLSLANVSQALLKITEVDLSAIARSILADLQERDRSRVVVVRVDAGLNASGDARLLKMALENLLGNAWKFTGKKKVAHIEFTAVVTPDGERAYQVKDDGAGFDMAYAQKLFGNFQRLHREAEFAGTGIGLANVQKIIQRHGGHISAQAVEGQGATFTFTLPLPVPALSSA